MNLAELLDVVNVSPDGEARFIGRSPAGRQRPVYGGQLLAQALLAANATVPDDGRSPHSLHGYFIRSGSSADPIQYRVDTIRDGRSFSHRHIVAGQDEREIFRMLASFHVPTSSPSHDDRLPVTDVDPETLPDYREWVGAATSDADHEYLHETLPIDLRFEDAPQPEPGQTIRGTQRIWMRIRGDVATDDPALHAALLAWLSDKTVADFGVLAHGKRWTDEGVDSVSLDHGMWFLRHARADRWIVFAQDSPSTAGGRGLNRGDMALADGTRIAAVVQEALLTLPG